MTRSQRRHAEEKVEGRTHSVEVLSGVACRHLQTFHSGLKNYLQQEWDFPACHPAHKGVITPGGGGLGAILPHRSFQGRHRRCAIVRYHPPVSQAGGDGNSKPDFVRLGELERLTCHHNTPVSSSPQAKRVQNRGSHNSPVGGPRGYLAPSSELGM